MMKNGIEHNANQMVLPSTVVAGVMLRLEARRTKGARCKVIPKVPLKGMSDEGSDVKRGKPSAGT
jgi:hypothetical protein